jgi:hypothetical protein
MLGRSLVEVCAYTSPYNDGVHDFIVAPNAKDITLASTTIVDTYLAFITFTQYLVFKSI